MSERIVQGDEDPAAALARKAAWDARDTDLANTPETFEDLVRLTRLLTTPAQRAQAKRDRGKPFP